MDLPHAQRPEFAMLLDDAQDGVQERLFRRRKLTPALVAMRVDVESVHSLLRAASFASRSATSF